MKKLVLGTFTVLLCTGLLFGCGNANDNKDEKAEETHDQQKHKNEPEKSSY